MRAPYKFSIVNQATQFWRVNPDGTVSAGADAVYMGDSIIDWDTLGLDYKRDSVFLGVIRSMSPEQVRFAKDGAKILRYIKNTQGGSEAVAYFGVSVLNSLTQQYQLLDYWQFDFSETGNERDDYAVALMEGGLSALLKANAPTNYNIPLNDPALAPDFPLYNPMPADALPLTPPTNNPIPPPVPKLIYMDGIPIMGSQQYTSNPDGEVVEITSGFSTDGPKTMSLFPSQQIGDYTVGAAQACMLNKRGGSEPVADTGIFIENQTWSSKMTIAFNANIQYDVLPLSFTGTLKLCLLYEVWAGDPTNPAVWGAQLAAGVLWQDPVGVVSAGGSTPVSSPNINARGEYVVPIEVDPWNIVVVTWSYGTFPTAGTFGGQINVNIPSYDLATTIPLPVISLNFTFVPPSTVVRAISHNDLFQYLFNQLVGNGGALPFPGQPGPQQNFTARSNLLSVAPVDETGNFDLNPVYTFFTCADSLRGLKTYTIQDPAYNGGLPTNVYLVPAIYTNMQDFATDLLTDLCASIGIEKNGFGTDKLVAESLYYFFDDNTVIADLGENITNFRMEDFNDYRGSSIAFGQADQQFDSLNGPLETMSEVDFGTPITRIIKDIDFKTPYSSSPYQIELFRANIGNKTNVNSSSDNDTVKIQVQNLDIETIPGLYNWQGISGYPAGSPPVVEVLRLKRATQVVSGLPAALLSPTVNPYPMYNVSFTPQRKALRALPWLCSNYRGLPNCLMAITAYKKNIQLVCQAGSGIITESNWINVSDTAQTYTPPFSTTPVTVQPAPIPAGRANNMIFKPYKFFFDSPVPINLLLLMTPPSTGGGGGKMYGKFKFTFVRDGIKYPLAGFVWDVGITPGTNASYHYELLCSPTVDIPPLL